MFLDENGRRFQDQGQWSHDDEWLTYAPGESLPSIFTAIPKGPSSYRSRSFPRRWTNISNSWPPIPISRSTRNSAIRFIIFMVGGAPGTDADQLCLLLNLVAVASTDDKALLWGSSNAIVRPPRRKHRNSTRYSISRGLFRDFVAARCDGALDDIEAEALRDLDSRLAVSAAMPTPRRFRRRFMMSEGASVRIASGLVPRALRDTARYQPGTAHGQLFALTSGKQPQADRQALIGPADPHGD